MKKRILLLSFIALSSIPAFAQNVPSYVPSNGLVGWWPFNGNANDESGNGNNGTVNGATLTTDRFGLSNKAYSFDGENNFIVIPNGANIIDTAFTISIWLKKYSNNTENRVMSFERAGAPDGFQFRIAIEEISWYPDYGKIYYHCGIDTVGTLLWNNNTGYSLKSNSTFSDSSWQNIIITKDGSNFKMYLNNQIETTTQSTAMLNFFNNTNSILIGAVYQAFNDSTVNNFNGEIDDIGIWNRALTQQEITDLYNGTSAHTNQNSLPLASVHPNPTTGEITITSNELHSQCYSLYNSLGQLVASGKLNAEKTTLSIQEFAPGIYTLQLQGEKNTTLKIVKE